MISRNDQLTVLSRIFIPLMDVAERKGYKVRFEAYMSFCDFVVYYEDGEDFYLRWSCYYDEDHDWNAGRSGVSFRTFESLKEIMLTIREALENE